MKDKYLHTFQTLKKLIFILFCILAFSNTGQAQSPVAKNGIIDLSGFNFSDSSIVNLSGEWEFYWNQLLSGSDFDTVKTHKLMMIPRMWNYGDVDSINYPGSGYATYRLRMINPPKHPHIALEINKIYTAYNLYLNGKLIAKNGKFGTTDEASIPNYVPYVIPIEITCDTSEIVLHVSNFDHQEGGMFYPIRVGTPQILNHEKEGVLMLDLFLFGSIFIMALYHIVLYLLRRRSKSALYFGLYAFFVAIRTLLTSGEAFSLVYPDISMEVTLRIEYATLYLGAGFFIVFVQTLLPTQIPRWFSRTALYVGLAYVGTFIFPMEVFTKFLVSYQLFLLITMFTTIFFLVRAAFRKETDALLLLAVVFFVVAAATNDIFHTRGDINTTELSPVALFIFIFAQSYLLARRFNNAFIENEELTDTLEYQNKNLEKIVQARTSEIEQQKEELQAQSDLLLETNKELEKLSIVADQTDNAVVISDASGNIEWLNHGFTHLYGYNLSEFKSNFGENFTNISQSKDVQKHLNQVLTNKQTAVYESVMLSKAGEKIWAQTTITPVLDSNGNITKLVAIDSDISQQKYAQAEIMQRNEEIMTQKEALQQKTEEISAQRDELQITNKKIDIQNQKINSSIRYALNIQKAILPSENDIINAFQDAFIYYLPKDVVSGDFFWYNKIKNESLDCSFLAVVDCTGHGVPGAFMSMIGSRLLNTIVNERHITSPKDILTEMDKGIIKALKQDSSANNDGMDLCLIKHEKQADNKHKITFCGAKRPLYYIKAGSKTMTRIGGDRRTIGGTNIRIEKQNFTNTELILDKNDTLYLSTDGFIDQNDYSRTRFGSVRFENLISEISNNPMSEQKEIVHEIFLKWKQKEEQRDDITLVGIKL